MYTFDPRRCRNLVLDLGGVLYGVELQRSVQAFAALQPTRPPADPLTDPIFPALEKGAISPEVFYDHLRKAWDMQADNSAILSAWNAMLTGLIPGRVEMMLRLRSRYRLALLSNTNILHFEYLLPETRELFAAFEQCFLSFEMGMRKPDAEIYLAVLESTGFKPEETVFIDDNVSNVRGAMSTGMAGLHFRQEDDLEKWFFHPQ